MFTLLYLTCSSLSDFDRPRASYLRLRPPTRITLFHTSSRLTTPINALATTVAGGSPEQMDLNAVKKSLEAAAEETLPQSSLDSLPPRFYDAFVLHGLRVDRVERGRVLCSMTVPARLLVRNLTIFSSFYLVSDYVIGYLLCLRFILCRTRGISCTEGRRLLWWTWLGRRRSTVQERRPAGSPSRSAFLISMPPMLMLVSFFLTLI